MEGGNTCVSGGRGGVVEAEENNYLVIIQKWRIYVNVGLTPDCDGSGAQQLMDVNVKGPHDVVRKLI